MSTTFSLSVNCCGPRETGEGLYADDKRRYAICKNEILVKILKKAGWSEEELEPVREANR